MTLDIRIELRGEEVALDHVAFELCHVDAVGRKAAERLVECGGHVAHPKQERGNDRAAIARGPFCIARKNDEARCVVVFVLRYIAQDVEPLDLPVSTSGTGC